MAWETRKGRRYYYRKERGADGRVRSIYCGSGERGEQAAREDEARRGVAAEVGESPSLISPPDPALGRLLAFLYMERARRERQIYRRVSDETAEKLRAASRWGDL